MNAPRSDTASSMMAAGALFLSLIATGCGVKSGDDAKVAPLFAQWNRPDSPGAAVVVVRDGPCGATVQNPAALSGLGILLTVYPGRRSRTRLPWAIHLPGFPPFIRFRRDKSAISGCSPLTSGC